MKEGWSYKRFKDICYSISDGDWIEKKDQSNSGIRLIQTGNIGVGKFIPKDDSRKFISEETFNRLKCCEIYEGDILISRLPNPLGRSCILPQLNTRCITAVDCSILKIKHEIVLPHYFMYYTQSKGYFSKIESESSGTTRARITRKKIEETIIPVPPLSEQRSIVTRLDAAFSHIDTLKANAEKQLNEARKLFQAELTECMKPKEGWEEKTLKEVGITQTGTTPPKSDTSNYGEYISFIRPAELNFDGMGGINYESEIKLSEKGVERSRLIKANSILMCCIGSVGKMGFSTKEVTCNQQINTITPKSNYSPKFVYYAMLDKKFLDDIIKEAKSAQATLPIISKGKWERHKIHVPYLVEQHSIVSHLDSLSSTIRKLEELQQKTIAECDALKQAMLREVFE